MVALNKRRYCYSIKRLLGLLLGIYRYTLIDTPLKHTEQKALRRAKTNHVLLDLEQLKFCNLFGVCYKHIVDFMFCMNIVTCNNFVFVCTLLGNMFKSCLFSHEASQSVFHPLKSTYNRIYMQMKYV